LRDARRTLSAFNTSVLRCVIGLGTVVDPGVGMRPPDAGSWPLVGVRPSMPRPRSASHESIAAMNSSAL
jgi:hypothetical protein